MESSRRTRASPPGRSTSLACSAPTLCSIARSFFGISAPAWNLVGFEPRASRFTQTICYRQRIAKRNNIWYFAFGYFACYAPYSALTKSLSNGSYSELGAVAGATLLPVATLTSLAVMLVFLTSMRWWRYATHRKVFGRSIPVPTRWTALSGLCTSVILTTTTLAYTFDGVSIVFVMLLMRGGVLILAPVVDAITGRKQRWFSWIGLALSITALFVAFAEDGGCLVTLASAVDIAFYLGAYFIRLRFMSRLAKSPDREVTLRYFVEEQLVATPSTVLLLIVAALLGADSTSLLGDIHAGFTSHLESGFVFETILIGALSQGTGIFGTLVFLDPSENTFSVPVNRCSSILAGVLASAGLALFLDVQWPSAHQLVGAGFVVLAIGALTLGPLLGRSGAETKAA